MNFVSAHSAETKGTNFGSIKSSFIYQMGRSITLAIEIFKLYTDKGLESLVSFPSFEDWKYKFREPFPWISILPTVSIM